MSLKDEIFREASPGNLFFEVFGYFFEVFLNIEKAVESPPRQNLKIESRRAIGSLFSRKKFKN